MVFEDLSITIGARTGDAERSIENTDEKLDDLSGQALRTGGAFEVLENSVDGTARSLSSLGRRSSVAVGGVSGLTLSLLGLESAGAAAGTTLSVALLPTVTALATVAAPLVGILGGLGAVLGAFGAVGVAGTVAATAQNTAFLKNQLLETVSVFQEELAPAASVFTSIFTILLGELEEAADQIVPSRDVFEEVGSVLLNVGRAVIDILPAVSDLASELIFRFAPAISDVLRSGIRRLPNVIRTLVDVFQRFLPQLVDFGLAIGSAIPDVLRFGSAILQQLLPALTAGARAFGDILGGVLDFINSTDSVAEAFRKIAEAIPVDAILNTAGDLADDVVTRIETDLITDQNIQKAKSAFNDLISSGVDALINFLTTEDAGNRFATAFDTLTDVSIDLKSAAESGVSSLTSFIASEDGQQLLREAGEIIGELLVRGAKVAFDLGEILTRLSGFVSENLPEIKSLAVAIGKPIGQGIADGAVTAFEDVFGPQIKSSLIDLVLNQLRSGLTFALSQSLGIPKGTIEDALPEVGEVQQFAGQLEQQAARQRQQINPVEEIENALSNIERPPIEVRVEGDTGVVRDVAAGEIREESRRQQQRGGFTGAPGG